MSGVALRLMAPADIVAVLGLERSLFGEEAWSRQMLAGELREQPASRYYLVALDGGTLVGYGGLLAAGRQADVVTLAVAADQWGRGIGSALLTTLLTEAARRGCSEVFLEVRTDNQRAQQLYRRYGFAPIGVRKGYYQPSGADALVMRRALEPGGHAGPASPADTEAGRSSAAEATP
jgi:[ribosomal protein S18]-alanine N-acetyltransferase